MAAQMAEQGVGPSGAPGIPFTSEADTGVFTKPILDAIDVCKVALMVRIDHLVSERTLNRHDLDKIRSRLTTAQGCISDVEDSSTSHTAQLSELQDLVRTLQHRADDAEKRQRRNIVLVVGLAEGGRRSQANYLCGAVFQADPGFD